jgi:Domain of unknown function (DUF222)
MGQAAAEFGSVDEALGAARSVWKYLAAADASQLPATVTAEVLRELEKLDAAEAAVRGRLLWYFDLQRGYEGEGHGGVRSFVRYGTTVTKGQADAHIGLMKARDAHRPFEQAMLDGHLTLSVARRTGKLTARISDGDVRGCVDQMIVTAAAAGASEHDLMVIAAAALERFAPPDPDQPVKDRDLRLETTFEGAGVLRGELTPQCAAMLGAVLSRLALKRGKDDDRGIGQRQHDALQEMARQLLGSDLLPRQGGHAVMANVHIWLGDLMDLDDGSVLARAWTERYAAKWAAKRIEAAEGMGDGGAWITGPAAASIACDAAMFPVVWGDPDLDAAEDLLRIAVELDGYLHSHDDDLPTGNSTTPDSTGSTTPDSTTPDSTAADSTVTDSAAADSAAAESGNRADRLGDAVRDPGRAAAVTRLMQQLIGAAARMMSGEPGLAAFLRRGLLGPLGLGGASLPLDAGDTDHVPWWIRQIVHTRDGHCQFPAGCDKAAGDCHQHHIVPRSEHGHSSTENLGDKCKQHHLYTIHASGWKIRKFGDGTWEATAPDGRTFKTPGRRAPPPQPG